MTLVFTDDQEQFRESIQRFLADQMPTTKVRQLMATEHGSDPAVWQQASAQLALTGIHIPEAFGGAVPCCQTAGSLPCSVAISWRTLVVGI